MSLMKTYAVECDLCQRWCSPESHSGKEARQQARRRGWKRKNKLDFCDECMKRKGTNTAGEQVEA